MYARLRQKLTITQGTVVADTGTGTNAFSVLLKDIARCITGQATSLSQLNSNIWDIANSELVSSGQTGWSEYQSSFTSTTTSLTPSTALGNSNIIYLRAVSDSKTSLGGSIYKYTGLGLINNTLSTGASWNIMHPWYINDFSASAPSLTFKCNTTADYIDNSFISSTLCEYIIHASQKAIVISATFIGAGHTQPAKIVFLLEYPSTAMSSVANLPNQVWWELSSNNGANTANITTATPSAAATGTTYTITGYRLAGGYNPVATTGGGYVSTTGVTNLNRAFVFAQYDQSLGNTSLWSSTSITPEISTLKPSIYTTMSSTIDSAGNVIGVPMLPLIHYPPWDSVYDLSSLTGVYATKPAIGGNGDNLTINGIPYAYINSSTMGYLVPKQ